MTLEELKKKRDELKAKADEIAIQKEIKELEAITIEPVAPKTAEQVNKQLIEAAKNDENNEGVKEAVVELKALLDRANKEHADAYVSKSRRISRTVEKMFGAEGREVVAQANDLAPMLPLFHAVSQMTKTPVWELQRFKTAFGNVGEAGFKKMVKAIGEHNRMTVSLGAKTPQDFVKKILETGNDGDWINTNTGSQAEMHIMQSKAAFQVCTPFRMPSNPFNWPISTGYSSLAGRKVTEGTSVTADDTGVGKIQFDAPTVQRVVEISDEMSEDAAFQLAPFVLQQATDALGDSVDRMVFFGDETSANPSTNINDIDTDGATAEGVYLAIDGLAHFALIGNGKDKDVSGSTDDALAIVDVMIEMGYGAADPSKLKMACNPSHYFKLIKLLTKEGDYGAASTAKSGRAVNLYGVDIHLTNGIPMTNDNGKVDGETAGNNDHTSFIIARKDKCLLGVWRDVRNEEEYYPVSGKRVLGVSTRLDVQVTEANAVGYGYER